MVKKVYWYYETELATSTKSHAYDTEDKRLIGGAANDQKNRANGFRKTLCGKVFQEKPTQGETYIEDYFTKIGCRRCASILAKKTPLESAAAADSIHPPTDARRSSLGAK